MKVTLDRSADAAYIYLAEIGPGEAVQTHAIFPSEVGGHMINLDFDRNWRLLGVEILDASKALPSQVLDQAEVIG